MEREEVYKKVVAAFQDVMIEKNITEGSLTDLQNSGISSVDFIQIVVNIEMKFDIEFDDDAIIWSDYKSVDDILDYVLSKI